MGNVLVPSVASGGLSAELHSATPQFSSRHTKKISFIEDIAETVEAAVWECGCFIDIDDLC